jgi:hypothetical protein
VRVLPQGECAAVEWPGGGAHLQAPHADDAAASFGSVKPCTAVGTTCTKAVSRRRQVRNPSSR